MGKRLEASRRKCGVGSRPTDDGRGNNLPSWFREGVFRRLEMKYEGTDNKTMRNNVQIPLKSHGESGACRTAGE